MKEKILCAAIWYKEQDTPKNTSITPDMNGLVMCGYRHAYIIGQCVSIAGKRQAEMGEYVQGFLTNKNRFVDRKEALQIALRENQVIDLSQVRGDNLYSEDLY